MLKKNHFKICLGLVIVSIASFSIVGCKDLPMAGNYRGKLTIHHLSSSLEAEKVDAEVGLTYGHHHLTANVTDPSTHADLLKPLTIVQKSEHTVEISIPDYPSVQGKPLVLKKLKSASGTCYRSIEASLCFNPDNFSLSVQGYNFEKLHLYASQFQPSRELKLEPTQSFTVDQGVKLILEKNYNVQEAKQSLLRANETAKRSYLNLLPHMSVGGAITVATVILGNYFEICRPINDLVSFIFPGKWIKAEATVWQARAERLAYSLFQLTMGTSLQTQALTYHVHKHLRDDLQALQDQLTEVLKIAQNLAGQNRIDSNSILTMQIALSDLNVSLWQAKNQYMQDKIGISQTLGFENPQAVDDIILESETTSIDQVLPLGPLGDEELLREKNKYAELAVNNSFELKQLDYLRRAAVLNEKNVFVNWLDVYATINLGANMVADARLAQSMITSVEIKAEKTRQALIAKVYNLVRDRNLLRLSYDTISESLLVRRERLKLVIDRLKIYAASSDPNEKLTVGASDIRGSVRDVSAGLTTYYSTLAGIQIDQTILNRLALQGVYEKFLPHLDGNEASN